MATILLVASHKAGSHRFCGVVSRHVISRALEKVPTDLLSDEERGVYNHLATLPQITILQLIYQQKAYEGHAKDYEFSGTSMREHWQSGYEDTKRTLKSREWMKMPDDGVGIVVHDVHREHDR